MKTWIALLRGINVGGSHLLPMKELSAVFEKAGCRDVKTYVQSGNVVFRSPMSDASRLSAHLLAAVSAGRGFAPSVRVVDPSELKRAVAANPFPKATAEPGTLHLLFLFGTPKPANLESLNGIKAKSESFALRGRVLYLHTPDGLGRSKLGQRLERSIGVEATARNWRTVSALLALAASYE